MKCAILVSGMPRNLENSYKWLEDSILSVLRENCINYDIFISTWQDKDIQKFIDVYKPVSWEQEIWNDEMADKLGWQEFKNNKFEIESRASALAQFYKIMKCNNLRRKYEEDNNIEYDIIFRLRTELKFLTKLDIKELEIINNNKDKKLIFLRRGPNGVYENWTKDNFAFGNSDSMNIYSNLSPNLLSISKEFKCNTAELLLRNWLHKNNVQCEHTSLDYFLTRE